MHRPDDPARPPVDAGAGPADASRGHSSSEHAARATRNLGWLVVQRALDVGAGALFVLLVPRLLGPSEFGKWALLTAIALWFALVSSMSSTQIAVRFLPALAAPAERAALERFVGGLVAVRLVGAAGAAAAYFVLTALWLDEIAPGALALVAAAVFLRSLAKVLFALFLGLGQAARWGVGEALRRWLAVACIVAGVYRHGLIGACWGMFASELLVAALGLFWARSLLRQRHLRLVPRELAPYLHFGTRFAAGTILLALSQRSGELLLRSTDVDYAAIGVFGVAYRAYLAGTLTIWQLSMAFAPEFGAMIAAGTRDRLARWAERLMIAGAVAGIAAALVASLVGPHLLPLALGARYAEAASHLVPLALALVGMALGAVCQLEAIVLDRWDVTLGGAALHLAVFWLAGALLVGRLGPLGASLAALGAAATYGVFMAFALRRIAGHRLGRWVRAVALGLPWFALAVWRGTLVTDALLCAAALAGYALVLFQFGVLRTDELATLRAALRRRPREPAAE